MIAPRIAVMNYVFTQNLQFYNLIFMLWHAIGGFNYYQFQFNSYFNKTICLKFKTHFPYAFRSKIHLMYFWSKRIRKPHTLHESMSYKAYKAMILCPYHSLPYNENWIRQLINLWLDKHFPPLHLELHTTFAFVHALSPIVWFPIDIGKLWWLVTIRLEWGKWK